MRVRAIKGWLTYAESVLAAPGAIYIRRVRTVTVAGFVAAAIMAGGWGLQSLGLPPPSRGNEAAVRAAVWFMRYRLASSSVRIGRHLQRGRCYHGWFDNGTGRDRRGTLLVLNDGHSVAAASRRPDVPAHLSDSALRELELAGCTDVLGPRIDSYALANTVRMSRTLVLDQPALAIRLHRLTLFVSPRTDQPFGVQLGALRSTIALMPMTPTLARRLGAER